MADKKIIDWESISCGYLDDKEEFGHTYEGLNSKAKKLIQDGYVPYGEMQVTHSPTYVMQGTATTLGGYATYIREFVKYEK